MAVSVLKIIKFQKRAERIILDNDFHTPFPGLFAELNWMSFAESIAFQKAIAMFKNFNGVCPDYFKLLCTYIRIS